MTDKRPREAIIFVPGLGLGIAPEKTKHGVVTRIARALDHEAATAAVEFPVRLKDGAVAAVSGGSTVGTISREDASGEQPILDCYAYEWSNILRSRWREQALWKRFFRVLFTLTNVGAFLRFFATSGRKNPKGIAQLVLAVGLVVVMLLYVALLVFALWQSAGQFKDKHVDESPTAQTDKQQKGKNDKQKDGQPGRAAAKDKPETGDDGATPAQWAALIGAGAAAAFPKVRRRITTIGAGLGATASYIRVGEAKPQITGGLASLINDITRDHEYQRITVIAYSFGSIVALDTLFPTTGQPAQSLDRVKTLVTIGSPYDFVTALKPAWRDGRHVLEGVPERWINIFSSIDLMGSNYRPDKDLGEATLGLGAAPEEVAVAPTHNVRWDLGIEPRWTNLLEFHGFASHSLYWGRDQDMEHNVFATVVARAYADAAFLD